MPAIKASVRAKDRALLDLFKQLLDLRSLTDADVYLSRLQFCLHIARAPRAFDELCR